MRPKPSTPPVDTELETATDDAIAACGGDARAAVTALIVTLHVYEAEIADIRRILQSTRASVSLGYVRGRYVADEACDDAAS